MSDSAVMLELRRLVDEVAALRDEQEHLHRRLLSRDDARLGSAMLPLAAQMGVVPFAPVELAAAALADRSAEGTALRELLHDFTDSDGGYRALAWLFRRIEGAPLGGHRLVRVAESRLGVRYRVQVVGA